MPILNRVNENLLPTTSSETRNVESIIAKFDNNSSIVTIHNRFDKNIYSPLKKLGKLRFSKKKIS